MDVPCITIALVAFGDDETAMKTKLQQVDESHPTGAVSRCFYQTTSLQHEFAIQEKSFPVNHYYCVDNAFMKNDVDVADVLERAFATLPTKKSLVLWNTLVPRSRSELPDMAFSMQSDHYFAMYGICELETVYPNCKSWVRETMAEVEKHEVGAYVGEFDLEARQTKLWADESRTKLMQIIQKWDPDGRFCSYLGLDSTDSGVDQIRSKNCGAN
jgi:hypothetical protein